MSDPMNLFDVPSCEAILAQTHTYWADSVTRAQRALVDTQRIAADAIDVAERRLERAKVREQGR